MGSKQSQPSAESFIAHRPPRDLQREHYLSHDNKFVIDLLEEAKKKLIRLQSCQSRDVDLSTHGLKAVPAELFDLADVNSIDLSYNRLDTLPPQFFDCFAPTLQTLKLRATWLQKEKMTGFSKLTSLTYLDLSWNWLSHLDWLADLINLKFLSIKHGKFDGSFDLSKLKSLEHLDVSENSLVKIPMPHVDSPLKFLNASYNTLAEVPDNLDKYRELETLNISFNRTLLSIPASLAKCLKLVDLNLGGILIQSIPLEFGAPGALPSLKKLVLHLTNLSSFPAEVLSLTTLTHLEYSGHKPSSIAGDFSCMTNLQGLILRCNELAELPEMLWQLPHLRELDVSGNKIASIPKHISSLSSLEYLDLSCNQLTSLPSELGTLLRLRSLHIMANPIGGALENISFVSPSAAGVLAHLSGRSEADYPGPVEDSFHEQLPCIELPFSVSAVAKLPDNATTLNAEQLRDKIFGMIVGNAVGDAIGLSTEFMNIMECTMRYGHFDLEYESIVSDRHRGRFARGDFTDDTDQMLLILYNLLRNDLKPNVMEFADDLLRWANVGAAEFGDNVGWGIGATVASVIESPGFLQDPHKAAVEMWEKAKRGPAANGALMRTSVLSVPQFFDDEAVIRQTLDICLVTHADYRCQASCVATTTAMARLLRGEHDLARIQQEAHDLGFRLLQGAEEKEEYTNYMKILSLAEMRLGDSAKMGYTLKTFGAAFWALRNSGLGFRTAMMRIVHQCGDADTNGAVAGALLGCCLGFRRIPKSWIDGLIHLDFILQRAEHLCRLLGI